MKTIEKRLKIIKCQILVQFSINVTLIKNNRIFSISSICL